MKARRIAVATTDTLTARMAGPAIRAWHLAEELAAEHEVVLLSAAGADRSHSGFPVIRADEDALRTLEAWMDVLVVQGGLLHVNPWLLDSDKIIVADLYDLSHLENLEQIRDADPESADAAVARQTAVLNEQLLRGDFFLCASARQRDFWLGALAALGRVNPYTYEGDERLRSLIDIVPFGLPATPPVQRRHGIRGVVPGIGPDDKVVLWAGGVYNWFDPCSLVRAVDLVRAQVPEVRLYFLGMRHPNPQIPAMRVATELIQLSAELGLTDRWVFFNDKWVEYETRADFLLDADVGVSTHLDHVETAYSFRTRILDYLWAGLPMVVTEGDSFAELVRSNNLGAAVAPGDPEAIAAALLAVLAEPPARSAVWEVAEQFTWDRVVTPLIEFCRLPRRAPDLVARSKGPLSPVTEAVGATRVVTSDCSGLTWPGHLKSLVGRVRASIETDGVWVTTKRVARFVLRRLRVRSAERGPDV
jgi:glycosyltransferase involved in cell wall biosynthesis